MNDAILLLVEALALCLDVNVKALSVLAFKTKLILYLTLAVLLEVNSLDVLVIDVGVSFELAVARLHLNLTRISLTTEIELDHWDTQELGV